MLTFLGNVRSLQGRHSEALSVLRMAADLGAAASPRFSRGSNRRHARAGQSDEASKAFSEMTTLASRSYAESDVAASAHAAAGRGDDALAWLDALTKVGDRGRSHDYPGSGLGSPARSSRFQAVLRKMGIPTMTQDCRPGGMLEPSGRAFDVSPRVTRTTCWRRSMLLNDEVGSWTVG